MADGFFRFVSMGVAASVIDSGVRPSTVPLPDAASPVYARNRPVALGANTGIVTRGAGALSAKDGQRREKRKDRSAGVFFAPLIVLLALGTSVRFPSPSSALPSTDIPNRRVKRLRSARQKPVPQG